MAYSTISKPSLHFNTVTYSGTGSAQSITGVGFRPDWLWIKHREDVSNHKLQDVVRGSTKVIGSNETSAEATVAQGVTSFDSDGFSLGTDASVNGTGAAGIVAWNWLAGGSQGSSNTDGSINTTYTSANTTAGFSISQYTGTGSNATVGHGLGVRPDLVFIKRLNSSSNWVVMSVGSSDSAPYQTIGSNDSNLGLNLTRQVSGSEAVGDNRLSTNSSNTIYNIGNDASVNASGGTYIAYCFRSITGYSKFGSYTGNGNADGPFAYTGFKPAFVITKRSNATGYWVINDNKRTSSGGGNGSDKWIYPNANDAEYNASSYPMDLLSNGFKVRHTGSYQNTSSGTYIYLAFAEEPLVANVGTSIPATAR